MIFGLLFVYKLAKSCSRSSKINALIFLVSPGQSLSSQLASSHFRVPSHVLSAGDPIRFKSQFDQ